MFIYEENHIIMRKNIMVKHGHNEMLPKYRKYSIQDKHNKIRHLIDLVYTIQSGYRFIDSGK